jgi:hypothetical protein
MTTSHKGLGKKPNVKHANLEEGDEEAWSTLPSRKKSKPFATRTRAGITTTARFTLPIIKPSIPDPKRDADRDKRLDGRSKPTAYRPPPRMHVKDDIENIESEEGPAGWKIVSVYR